MKRYLLVFGLILGMFLMVSCGDDDKGTGPTVVPDPWIGTWLSAGTDVAPILVSLFKYDSVRVELKDTKIVKTSSHVKNGAWTTIEGTYAITKSATGDIHTVQFVYAAFTQVGIVQVIKGTPDVLKLEAVQTIPNINAVPRTPATGFGSDPALGVLNIQKYVRVK